MGNRWRLDNGGLDAQQSTEFKQLVENLWILENCVPVGSGSTQQGLANGTAHLHSCSGAPVCPGRLISNSAWFDSLVNESYQLLCPFDSTTQTLGKQVNSPAHPLSIALALSDQEAWPETLESHRTNPTAPLEDRAKPAALPAGEQTFQSCLTR